LDGALLNIHALNQGQAAFQRCFPSAFFSLLLDSRGPHHLPFLNKIHRIQGFADNLTFGASIAQRNLRVRAEKHEFVLAVVTEIQLSAFSSVSGQASWGIAARLAEYGRG
jgi:hypothetical protein